MGHVVGNVVPIIAIAAFAHLRFPPPNPVAQQARSTDRLHPRDIAALRNQYPWLEDYVFDPQRRRANGHRGLTPEEHVERVARMPCSHSFLYCMHGVTVQVRVVGVG